MSGYDAYKTWHMLFDAICIERGHLDNARLAGAYCELTRAATHAAYESAIKNLSNWREGKHTPNRRNFRALTLLLQVDEIEGGRERWHALYREAQRRRPSESADDSDEAADEASASGALPPPSRWQGLRAPLLALCAVAIVSGTMASIASLRTPEKPHKSPEAGPPVIDMTDLRIYWREMTVVEVGESAVIHGKRGRCGEQPPPWEEVFQYLPELATGVWSDGGVGYRVSRSCGGTTLARAVVFTATRPGEEKFLLYDDPVTIRVEAPVAVTQEDRSR